MRTSRGPSPRWAVPVFAGAAIALVPWIVLLVRLLPSTHRATHWDVAWGGFDAMLAVLLLALTVLAWRRSPWLQIVASAAATLLFVDAWFDIMTSSTRDELIVAVAEAVLVELPLAFLCLFAARPLRSSTGRSRTVAST